MAWFHRFHFDLMYPSLPLSDEVCDHWCQQLHRLDGFALIELLVADSYQHHETIVGVHRTVNVNVVVAVVAAAAPAAVLLRLTRSWQYS